MALRNVTFRNLVNCASPGTVLAPGTVLVP
jgi:hypothetical protein